jgi:hypothetical protein
MKFASWLLLALVTAVLTGCGSKPPPPSVAPSPATSSAAMVTMTGRARNAKGGAALLGTDGTRTWVALPQGWPPEFVGRLVVVQGRLDHLVVPPVKDADDVVPAIGGEYPVLVDAKARLLE